MAKLCTDHREIIGTSLKFSAESRTPSPPKLHQDHNQMPKQTNPMPLQLYFPSATNHQSVKRLQAVWLVGNEIGFTLQRAQHTELLFFNRILSTFPRVAGEVPPAGTVGRPEAEGRGEGGGAVHGSEEIWKEAPACLSVKWREGESFLVHLSDA